MGDENLKDFTVNWIIGGLLLFCLLAFSITFMFNNNPTGLSDGTSEIFSESYDNYSSNLLDSEESADSLLNTTANTNPEVSDLGSRDSVSVGFEGAGKPRSLWTNSKYLLSWVFSGTVGSILMGVIGGLVGITMTFFIWRFIRNGL